MLTEVSMDGLRDGCMGTAIGTIDLNDVTEVQHSRRNSISSNCRYGGHNRSAMLQYDSLRDNIMECG